APRREANGAPGYTDCSEEAVERQVASGQVAGAVPAGHGKTRVERFFQRTADLLPITKLTLSRCGAMERIDAIVNWWFAGVTDETPLAADEPNVRRWFRAGPALDGEVRERFGEDHARAVGGELKGWESTARGRQALVLLIDQFSRHLERGTA